MNKSNSIRASSFRAAMVFLCAAAVAPFAFGCSPSSSSSSGSRSGLDESMQLTAATPAQHLQFCDWNATLYNGYGHSITKQCGDGGSFTGTISGPASQADCAAIRIDPSCTATVGQLEDCEIAIASSDPCALAAPPSCDAVNPCIKF